MVIWKTFSSTSFFLCYSFCFSSYHYFNVQLFFSFLSRSLVLFSHIDSLIPGERKSDNRITDSGNFVWMELTQWISFISLLSLCSNFHQVQQQWWAYIWFILMRSLHRLSQHVRFGNNQRSFRMNRRMNAWNAVNQIFKVIQFL